MKRITLSDKVTTSQPRRTADGYLVADAKVARTGIQEYLGVELDRADMRIVRVYRPEAEVFAKDSMASFAYRPMTNDHPSTMVDATNWRDLAIGQTGGEVVRDGEFVRVPLVMMDAKAIADWEAGKRELSMGYTAEIVFDSGTTPDGQPYDAIQTGLRMNHLALVDRARGGEQLRIGDNNPKPEKPQMSNRTVMVDGLSVETNDAGAQAIQKLQGDIAAQKQALADAGAAHKAALAAKDADIAKRDAEIDALKAKVLTDAQIDERVKARADLIAVAKAIADADYSGKSESEIRRIAVVAKLGDAVIAGKSAEYVQARFEILADEAKVDPVRAVLQTGAQHHVKDNGQSAYEQRLAGAYKTPAAA